jgi:methionyl-tRNA formyltransferase
MKIAYFGIDLFADCLGLCLSAGFEVAKIFTFSNDPYDSVEKITQIAKEHNIPLATQKVTEEDIAHLEEMGIQMMIVAGYAARIPLCSKMMQVNIHPSLLPMGRGAWPMPVNILRGAPSGVTLHKLAEGFDTGDIILQREIPLAIDENLETLTAKVLKTAPEILGEFLKDPKYYFENATTQGEGEYWQEPDDLDRTVLSSDTTEKADLILRAFYGYGVIYKGEPDCEILYGEVSETRPEGEFLPLKNGYIRIKTTP